MLDSWSGETNKRVLEKIQITNKGTGYKLYDEFYPDIGSWYHAEYEPIVQIESVDANGGILSVYIYKSGVYGPDVPNELNGIGLVNTKGNGTGATCDIQITPMTSNKVTVTTTTKIEIG